MDKLHILLAVLSFVLPALSALGVAWLKSHNHPQAAQVLEDALRAVVRGVETGGDQGTKDAIKSESVLAGVEHVLSPIVAAETAPVAPGAGDGK